MESLKGSQVVKFVERGEWKSPMQTWFPHGVWPDSDSKGNTGKADGISDTRKRLEDIFHKIDGNGDGSLQPEEFKQILLGKGLDESDFSFMKVETVAHVTDEEVHTLMKMVGTNDDGDIDIDTFLAFFLSWEADIDRQVKLSSTPRTFARIASKERRSSLGRSQQKSDCSPTPSMMAAHDRADGVLGFNKLVYGSIRFGKRALASLAADFSEKVWLSSHGGVANMDLVRETLRQKMWNRFVSEDLSLSEALVVLWHDKTVFGGLPGASSSLEIHVCVIGALIVDAIASRQLKMFPKEQEEHMLVVQDWHVSESIDLLCNEVEHVVEMGGGSCSYLTLLSAFLMEHSTRQIVLGSTLNQLCGRGILQRKRMCGGSNHYKQLDKAMVARLKKRIRGVVLYQDCPSIYIITLLKLMQVCDSMMINPYFSPKVFTRRETRSALYQERMKHLMSTNVWKAIEKIEMEGVDLYDGVTIRLSDTDSSTWGCCKKKKKKTTFRPSF